MKRAVWITGMVFGFAGQAHAYQEADVAGGGSVSGTVKLAKAPPKKEAHVVTKDHGVCGHEVANETYVVGKGQGFANVVVLIDGIAQGKKIGTPTALLDQKTCYYTPHVLAFPVGTQLFVQSSDDVLHNTHAHLGKNSLFNLALPSKGLKISRVMKKPGVVKFTCDAGHVWMEAYAYVTDHPYVTVTDKEGKFTLADVPAGTYTVKTWHEVEGERTSQVTVSAGGAATLEIAY